jgi:hypothetical protein
MAFTDFSCCGPGRNTVKFSKSLKSERATLTDAWEATLDLNRISFKFVVRFCQAL